MGMKIAAALHSRWSLNAWDVVVECILRRSFMCKTFEIDLKCWVLKFSFFTTAGHLVRFCCYSSRWYSSHLGSFLLWWWQCTGSRAAGWCARNPGYTQRLRGDRGTWTTCGKLGCSKCGRRLHLEEVGDFFFATKNRWEDVDFSWNLVDVTFESAYFFQKIGSAQPVQGWKSSTVWYKHLLEEALFSLDSSPKR